MYRPESVDVCLVVDLCPSPYDIERSRVLAPTVVRRSDIMRTTQGWRIETQYLHNSSVLDQNPYPRQSWDCRHLKTRESTTINGEQVDAYGRERYWVRHRECSLSQLRPALDRLVLMGKNLEREDGSNCHLLWALGPS